MSTVHSFYIFTDINFVSKRKEKSRTMVTQMCRLSVLFRSFFFISILFLLSSLYTYKTVVAKKKRKRIYVCVCMCVHIQVCSDGGSLHLHQIRTEERPWKIRQTHLYSLADIQLVITITFYFFFSIWYTYSLCLF
jgi:hypothetical protein